MTNQKPNLDRPFIQFLLRAQQVAQEDPRSERGYAMMVTSMITIVMFSMLAAYMTMTNLSKASTNAYVDGNNVFYAAESGMNRRAQAVRLKFAGYSRPTGTVPTNKMASCSSSIATEQGSGDFACVNYSFSSSAPSGRTVLTSSGGSMTASDQDDSKNYIARTFVLENPGNIPAANYPANRTIPEGDVFGGMSMQEYTYQVSSTAKQVNSINSNDTGQIVLQMNFRARLVPLFQFAAFYNGDLEILPGPAMTLSGPVHSNGSLYLGGGATLTIQGNVSSVGSIFSKRKNDNSTYNNGVVRITTSKTGVTPVVNTPLLAANGGNPTTNALSPNSLATTFGDKVKSGANTITIPRAGFLTKVDSDQSDGIGSYYGKADLRIEYQPNKTIPFTVTAIRTGVSGATSAACASLSISSDRNQGSNLDCHQLTPAQLSSLRKPVLVKALNDNERTLAPAGQNFAATPTAADRTKAIELQKLIAKSTGLLNFSAINVPLTGTSLPGIASTEIDPSVLGSSPQQIANRAGYYYLPPPIQIYDTFRNNREARTIQMLQTNLRSLAFWNRDNIVVSTAGVETSQDEVLFKRLSNPLATGSKYATVCNGITTDPRNLSLQCLGLAANDTSEGGMVIHATVDPSLADSPKTATTYPARQSPYGFAFVGGRNLPGGLTIASDQAVYLQGDYNYYNSSNTVNPSNTDVTHPFNMSNNTPSNSGLKEPASVLADSINILSNNCNLPTSTTDRLTCGTASTTDASPTALNVAFLAGTDITTTGSYNGGLENYPRFLEKWAGITLLYRGSFISLGTPENVNGPWSRPNYYTAPLRNWNYDLAFNSAENLPPLTPRLVYIRQDVFSQKY